MPNRNPPRFNLDIVLLAIAALSAGCMALPNGTAERALYGDARKIVEYSENLDWYVDRHAVEQAVPTVMASVCQATPETRARVLRWLDQQIEREGGSAREVFASNGRDLSEVGELLRLERIKAILVAATDSVEDDCPFWEEEDPDFGGVQGATGRVSVLAESIGGGGLIFQDGEVALGGSGGGRLLLMWGADERFSFGLGGELGAVATLPEAEGGGRTVTALFAGAIPVLFRFRDGLGLFDIEAAVTLRYFEDEVQQPGFRVMTGVGFTTQRSGGFLPYGLLTVGYELFPGQGASGLEHSLRVGTRIGIDWDLF